MECYQERLPNYWKNNGDKKMNFVPATSKETF